MASVGYGYGGYGKSHYGQPIFEIGEANLAQTSGLSASASMTFAVSATSAQTSGVTASGT